MTFPMDVSVPLLKDVQAQAPQAQCTLRPTNVTTNLIINSEAPPFDDPDMRRALALTLDRDAFNDILHEGKGLIGGTMLPPPAGVRSEEHTSELQSLMRISYAVFCL